MRLVSAGKGPEVRLPGNVTPSQDYRIFCDTNGVMVNGRGRGQLIFNNGGAVMTARVTASGMMRATYSEENQ